MMGLDLYRRYWDDASVTAALMVLKPGEDPDANVRGLQDALVGIQGVTVRPNQALRAEALAVFDRAFAIGVALNILREGGSLVWRSADGLMDRSLEPDVRAEIEKTLDGFRHQAIRFDHVVTRRAGQRRFVDLHMHMPAAWTLGRAAAVRAMLARLQELPWRRVDGARLTQTAAALLDPAAPDLDTWVSTNADGAPGYFRQRLYVYERAGLPCRRCRTPIRHITQGARSTYYCPTCQP
jgi:hypothetical protein